jgi:hypothetical protein
VKTLNTSCSNSGFDDPLPKILTQLDALHRTHEMTMAVISILAARLTDSTHLTTAEVARLKGVSTKTVRNWISSGKLTREVIPQTNQRGIPIREVFGGWIDENDAREIIRKQRSRNG